MRFLKLLVFFLILSFQLFLKHAQAQEKLPLKYYKSGFWGLANTQGERLTPPEFVAIGDFTYGFAKTQNIDGQIGLIYSSGKKVKLSQCDDLKYLGKGFLAVMTKSGWGGN